MPSAYSALTHLDCSRCQRSYDAGQIQGTCSCGAPLLARYDLEHAAGLVTPEQAQQMTEREALQLIFVAGFSTAKEVIGAPGAR